MVRRDAPKWVLFIRASCTVESISTPYTPRVARGIWLTHVKWLTTGGGFEVQERALPLGKF